MGEPDPATTVVICAYTERRWDDVVAALVAVRAQTAPAGEIILVVDHNPAFEQRAAAEFDDVLVVANSGRRGLSGARNTAIELAKGEVIVFLDDDAVPEPDWLEELLAGYRDPRVLGVGGSARPVWPDGHRSPLLPARGSGTGELDWVVGCTYTGQPEAEAPVRNLMGCNMSFRREVFELAGLFTEDLGRVGRTPLGCEETELCIRLHHASPDSLVLFRPSSVVRHRVTPDRLTWRYLRHRGWGEGVSKALVSRSVGADAALATERDYLRRVIPAAMLRELFRLPRTPGLFALFLVVGATAAGYVRGKLSRKRLRIRSSRPKLVHGPVHVAAVDVHNMPARLRVPPRSVGHYRAAQLLVRDGRRTLDVVLLPVRDGVVRLDLIGTGIPATPAKSGFERPLISVVVPTAHRKGQALASVRAALAAGYPKLDVIVVDNFPPGPDGDDWLREEVEKLGAHYLVEPRKGVSVARNTGAAASTGDFVAFLDENISVEPGWFDAVAEEFVADPEVGCVTAMVLPASLETDAEVLFERLKGYSHTVRRQRLDRETVGEDPLYPLSMARYGPGSCTTWRRSTFEGLRGFDPLLGAGTPAMAGEDLDLFVRLARAGGTVVYTPHAVARHTHRAGWLELREQMRGYGVGLSAMLLLSVLRRPIGVFSILARLPRGLARLRSRSPELPLSDRAARSRLRQLRRDERYGMLSGPLALARAWKRHRVDARSGPR
ncbi:glycosyltransferase [Amycolatopsis alkalitolerans]|uniref:Glycosyltransferase n=1 Tax=Amycolatopsis alkalitolerans TaxID=2547244 RepID=A0A5C4M3L0_9PSEU|nr:glycosyltransferase [Amycolatopsis alkalitolerans]TNC26463.1 glycosyltransferase [Amycolatopsis alkalitolerans]